MKNLQTLKSNITKPNILFWTLLLLVILPYLIVMSQRVGISADEQRHRAQAEKVYNYFNTGGKDTSALISSGIDPMQYNGQFFDDCMYSLEKAFNIQKIFEVRHLFNALNGWLIILFLGLTLKEIAGYRSAIFGIILLFIFPTFIGHACNNNKDIPFALGFMVAIYGLILFLKQQPQLSKKAFLFFTLGIAYAISIRLAGLIAIGIAGLSVVVYFLLHNKWRDIISKKGLKLFLKLALYTGLACIIGFFLGICRWPYLLVSPFDHFQKVLSAMSHHPVRLTQVFDGKVIFSTELPYYYTIRYMLISFPTYILVGISLFTLLIYKFRQRYNLYTIFVIAFTFIFVVSWMTLKNSNIYGAIRHLLFIYPMAVMMTVLGFDMLHQTLINRNKKLKWVTIILLSTGCLHSIIHDIRNYPYQYIYYNELVGGVDNMASKYETDYFQHSLRAGAEWLAKNELTKPNPNQKKLVIATTNDATVKYYLAKYNSNFKYDVNYTRYYEKYKNNWDYAIYYCGYISPFQIKNKYWPPKGTIHEIKVDNTVIGVVVKKVSDEYNEANLAASKGKPQEQISHLKAFLAQNESCEEAWYDLAIAYTRTNQLPLSMESIEEALKYYPEYRSAYFLKANLFQDQGNHNDAIIWYNKYIKQVPNASSAYCKLAISLNAIGEANEALAACNKAIQFNPNLDNSYIVAADILTEHKNFEKAIALYNRAESLGASSLSILDKKAFCYYIENKMDSTLACLNRMIKLSPNYIGAYKMRIRLLINEKNYVPAATLINELLRRFPNDAELKVIAVRYCIATNDQVERARAILTEVSKDPTQWEAKLLQMEYFQ